MMVPAALALPLVLLASPDEPLAARIVSVAPDVVPMPALVNVVSANDVDPGSIVDISDERGGISPVVPTSPPTVARAAAGPVTTARTSSRAATDAPIATDAPAATDESSGDSSAPWLAAACLSVVAAAAFAVWIVLQGRAASAPAARRRAGAAPAADGSVGAITSTDDGGSPPDEARRVEDEQRLRAERSRLTEEFRVAEAARLERERAQLEEERAQLAAEKARLEEERLLLAEEKARARARRNDDDIPPVDAPPRTAGRPADPGQAPPPPD